MPMQKGKHRMKLRRLGAPAGAQMLGANLTELETGAVSFPFHYHCATEEAIYVLRGKGVARIGERRVPVRAGDFIAYPVGPDYAHQMVNDGAEPLVYLFVSGNAQKVDVVGYPDSNKVAMSAGPSWNEPWVRQIHRRGESLGYYDDEPDAR